MFEYFRTILYIVEATPDLAYDGSYLRNRRQNFGQEDPVVLVAHDIKKVLPSMKLVITMRDPVDRYIYANNLNV